ncbi:MAG: hypothetical protein JXL97_18140 [Bacteroidales bacterium]|nr:hypothetical protein [Bacteroidales bacterium]
MALFFKQRGHYVFDYKPIYYDPKKEDRNKRLERIKSELGIKDDETVDSEYKPSFNFRKTSITRERRERTSTIRLLVILAFLVIFAYIFLYTDLIEKISNIVN